MKKIIISILLFFTVSFLIGFSIDWNGEKYKKITELEKKIENDNFKKKQE